MSGETPRRRHSPAVYRRRRLVLVIALLVIAAGVWLLIAQPWRGAAAQAPAPSPASPTPAATASADPTPTPDASTAPPAEASTEASPEATATAKPCVARDVSVQAVTDQESYDAGQNPQLSITLTNNSATDCTLNVGTSAQSFTITSGSDVWWRSTDCQTEPSDMVVLLAAGQTVSSATPLTWDRTRSSVGSCQDPGRQVAPGGGASYDLSVEIGGISSTQPARMMLY